MARTIRDSNEGKTTEVYHRYAMRNMVESRADRMAQQYAEYQLRQALGDPVG